jgi:hypothetical protein
MTDHGLFDFDRPAVHRQKVTAAFDGGLISLDSGLLRLGLMCPEEGIEGIRQGIPAPDCQIIKQDFRFTEQAP